MGCKSFHLNISLRGALMNWLSSDWLNCCRNDDGTVMSPSQVKAYFLDELAKGHEVIPCVSLSECPDFDFSGKGCPGHEVK